MLRKLFVVLSLLCFGLTSLVQAQQAASGKSLVGTWAGSWTGGSNGAFEMTITKAANGKLGGSITPKPAEGESYTAQFSSVMQTADKVTIKFPDSSGEMEVTLEATLSGVALKGSYSVRAKADGNEVNQGTFTASKKP